MADGSRHDVYLGPPEVTYGTCPASPAWTPIRGGKTTLALTKDTLESEENRSDRNVSDVRHGARKCGGDLPLELSYGSYDVILEALLCGTWASDTPTAGTAQLKNGTTRRSFPVLRKFADISDKPYHLYTGVEFDSLSLEVQANKMITGTIKMLGMDMTAGASAPASSTYNSASTTSPLDSFTGTMKEGGSTIALVTELKIDVNNNLGVRNVVGSKVTIKPSIKRCSVEGSASVYFENMTMMEKFINETESSMEFTLPDAAGNSYTFKLPRVKYLSGQVDVKDDGPLVLPMNFKALLDSNTSATIIIERTPHV